MTAICLISKGKDYWLYYTPERNAEVATSMRNAGGEWLKDCWKIPVDAARSALTAACRDVWTIKTKRLSKKELGKVALLIEEKKAKLIEDNKRKADTRKKVICGAVVLKAMAADKQLSDTIFALLDASLTAERDRALFGISDYFNNN